MGRHRTSEEKRALRVEAHRLRSEGRSRREIAAELHVGDDLLSVLLAATEVPPSLRRPRAKDELREVARELYRRGRSYREIERELSVSRSSLSLWLRDLRAQQPGASPSGVPPAEPSEDQRRQRARRLRRDGLLLKEIAAQLDVSTAAVHRWVRDLPVPKRARPGADRAQMDRMRREYWDRVLSERQEERAANRRAAASESAVMTPALLTALAAVAYWCEGSKSKPWRRQERLTFTNSDPNLILLFLAYLRQEGVADDRLRLTVAIHESADVEAAHEYWAEVAGVPRELFGAPTLKRHNAKTVRKNTGSVYVGCLVIGVRQSRQLYQRIEGTWQGIMAGVAARAAAA